MNRKQTSEEKYPKCRTPEAAANKTIGTHVSRQDIIRNHWRYCDCNPRIYYDHKEIPIPSPLRLDTESYISPVTEAVQMEIDQASGSRKRAKEASPTSEATAPKQYRLDDHL